MVMPLSGERKCPSAMPATVRRTNEPRDFRRGTDMQHAQTWQAWFVLSTLALIEACGDAASRSQPGVSPDAGDASPAPDVAPIIVMPRDAMPPDAGADGSDVCAPASSPTPTRCSNNTPQL